MAKQIDVANEVMIMKFLTMVFESDVETVAKVLTAMGDEARESLIDLAMTKDMTDAILVEVRAKFNEQVQLLHS